MVFSIFTIPCNCHQSRTFLLPQKETLPPNSPLAAINPLSVSMDLPVLDFSWKCNRTLDNLLCLAPFTQHDVFEVHPCYIRASMNQCHSFLWLIFHYVGGPHFVHPFISWWTVGLVPPFGDCDKWCEHAYTRIWLNICFQFFWVNTWEQNWWVTW